MFTVCSRPRIVPPDERYHEACDKRVTNFPRCNVTDVGCCERHNTKRSEKRHDKICIHASPRYRAINLPMISVSRLIDLYVLTHFILIGIMVSVSPVTFLRFFFLGINNLLFCR